MKKRLLTLTLVLALALTWLPMGLTAAAAGTDYTPVADTLKDLGLFLGTNTGYELGRNATRAEAATMVVRLLGKEAVAKAENNTHPFTDVPVWANPYVGYLYQHGITKGTSDTRYSADSPATPTQYATFLLRALGYSDANGDFAWDKAMAKMAELGIIPKADADAFGKTAGISRGVVVSLSRSALLAKPKNSSYTLLGRLYSADKVFTAAQFTAAAKRDAAMAALMPIYGLTHLTPSNTILNSEQMYAKASPAVFYIEVYEKGETEYYGTGSGFFITADGIAVTNYHVIEDAYAAKIHTSDGKTYDVDTVLGCSEDLDVAILKIKGSGFATLKLADPNTLRVAQRIYCLGSPGGFESTISEGLVSSTIKKQAQLDDRELIQISAPIAPGSSGGALLNEYGDVVGITSLGYTLGNLNFAIPVTDLMKVKLFDPPRSLQRIAEEAAWRYWFDYAYDTESETEPNDTAPVQLFEYDVLYTGALKDTTDIDLYKIEAKKHVDYFVAFSTDEAHISHISLTVVDLATGKVLAKSHRVPNLPYLYIEGHLKSGGNYAIRVTNDADETVKWANVAYEMAGDVWDVHTEETEPYDYLSTEEEPNDSLETANFLPLGHTMYGTIASDKDKDYYRFSLDSGMNTSFILMSTDGYSLKDNIRAEIYRADTNELITTIGGLTLQSVVFPKVSLSAGEYYAVVSPKSSMTTWPNSYVLYVGNLYSYYSE